MDVSVVIVNWNSGNYLQRLLVSLAPLGNQTQILVMDNGSTDSSFNCTGEWPNVRLIRWNTNRGFAAAANEGIRQAASAHILLLNPDVSIYPEAVRPLVQKLDENPDAGLMAAYLEDEQGELQHAFQLRPFPTVFNVIADALFFDEVLQLFKSSPAPQPLEEQNGACRPIREQPAAAFWLMRKRAWDGVGGFDEDFWPAWFEDVDFCLRLKKQGWKILFCPTIVGRHRGGISLDTLPQKEFLKIFYANLIQYWKKHHIVSLPLIWLPVKLGLLIRMLGAGWRC